MFREELTELQMKIQIRTTLLVAGLVALGYAGVFAKSPVSVILDTDIGNDVDDVLALGMLHALQSRGACRLLAVTVTKDHPAAAALTDAVNTFYGRGDIPVGVVSGGVTPEVGKFLPMVDQRDDGKRRYPFDLKKPPSAVSLLRRVLHNQPDRSVVVVQVGFSTNLARLISSQPDAESPLKGMDLVRRKVRLLSIMAGAFRPIDGHPRFLEYNVVKDLTHARKLVTDWPTSIVFSGFEIGYAVRFPAESIARDFCYVAHHPLAESYLLYEPPPHHRPTWDLTSVLYAVYPERGYFSLSEPGRVTVEDDGNTVFEVRPDGGHRYLILDNKQIERVREAMVHLASQPPDRK